MSLHKLYHANHLSYGAYNVTGRTIAASATNAEFLPFPSEPARISFTLSKRFAVKLILPLVSMDLFISAALVLSSFPLVPVVRTLPVRRH